MNKLTFEQVGVKAPGTPIKMPFLFLNKSCILTLFAGVSSIKTESGNLVPAFPKKNSKRQKFFM